MKLFHEIYPRFIHTDEVRDDMPCTHQRQFFCHSLKNPPLTGEKLNLAMLQDLICVNFAEAASARTFDLWLGLLDLRVNYCQRLSSRIDHWYTKRQWIGQGENKLCECTPQSYENPIGFNILFSFIYYFPRFFCSKEASYLSSLKCICFKAKRTDSIRRVLDGNWDWLQERMEWDFYAIFTPTDTSMIKNKNQSKTPPLWQNSTCCNQWKTIWAGFDYHSLPSAGRYRGDGAMTGGPLLFWYILMTKNHYSFA